MQLAPQVEQHPWHGGGLYWNRRTGRGLVLPELRLRETLAGEHPALQRRLADEGMLAGHDAHEPACLIPCISRRVLLLPEAPALWHPLPLQRTAGGFPYRGLALGFQELALLRACNAARSVAQVARLAGCSDDHALAFFHQLTALEVQALQLRRVPPRGLDPGLDRLTAPPRPRGHAANQLRGPAGDTALRGWHTHSITRAHRHFDQRETTLAHAFALPHPALGHQPFGARLLGALRERLGPRGCRGVLLEIGPGSGELGASWRQAAVAGDELPRIHLRLDASPALLAVQAYQQPDTAALLADAIAPPLRDGSVDLVICNEVIADLAAVPWNPERPALASNTPQGALAARITRYRLSPRGGLYNLGSWQLLEAIARLLSPGGCAYLSEFGSLDEQPRETAHMDHPEVSVQFGELLQVAQHLGLQTELLPMAELMGFDLSARWLARGSFEALRSLCARHDQPLASRAWTPASLPLPCKVEWLHWVPITLDGPGPVVTRFMALLLRRAR